MKGFRTIAVNGALAVLPIIDVALNNAEIVGAVLGDEKAGAVLSVVGLINLLLRWVTTTPMMRGDS